MITNKDVNFAGDLVRNLEGANQRVPQSLIDLANQVRLKSYRYLNDDKHGLKSCLCEKKCLKKKIYI